MTGRGSRAERTREALVAAAKEIFREVSFHDAKIADIAAGAQVAHGSFYTHFDSKEDIFLAVVDEVVNEGFLRTSIRRHLGGAATPAQQVEAANRRYFSMFRENARIMASIETLAPTVPAVEALRHQTVMAYTHRAAAAIRKWRSEAAVPADDDVITLAYCLSAMVERLAHLLYVMQVDEPGEAETLHALTNIWSSAIGLPPVTAMSHATAAGTDGCEADAAEGDCSDIRARTREGNCQ